MKMHHEIKLNVLMMGIFKTRRLVYLGQKDDICNWIFFVIIYDSKGPQYAI